MPDFISGFIPWAASQNGGLPVGSNPDIYQYFSILGIIALGVIVVAVIVGAFTRV